MTTVKDRILQLADILGVGRKRLAEEIGMTYSSFTGKARLTPLNSTAITNLLTTYPDVNANWLFTGDGEVFVKKEGDTGAGVHTKIQLAKDSGAIGYTTSPGQGGAYQPFMAKRVMADPSVTALPDKSDESSSPKAVPAAIVERMMDEQDRQGEIMLSQQRTIEKLVDKLPGQA